MSSQVVPGPEHAAHSAGARARARRMPPHRVGGDAITIAVAAEWHSGRPCPAGGLGPDGHASPTPDAGGRRPTLRAAVEDRRASRPVGSNPTPSASTGPTVVA